MRVGEVLVLFSCITDQILFKLSISNGEHKEFKIDESKYRDKLEKLSRE